MATAILFLVYLLKLANGSFKNMGNNIKLGTDFRLIKGMRHQASFINQFFDDQPRVLKQQYIQLCKSKTI